MSAAIVQGDRSVLLEVDHDAYEEARRVLARFAELEMLIADDDDDVDAPAPQPSTRSREGRPAARDLGVQSRDDVEKALRDATDAGAPLWLRVQSKSQGDRVVGLRPERLLARGADVAVLGTDVETGDGRSFPLANVVACRPA